MDTLHLILLVLHVCAGSVTLMASTVAIGTKLMNRWHRAHLMSGRLFFNGMAGIFVTALLMSLIRTNIPMLFVSVFSFYFAWMGRRYAINRSGIPGIPDRVIVPVMLLVFIGMVAYGIRAAFVLKLSFGAVIIVFGVIGTINAVADLMYLHRGKSGGVDRIVHHVGRMLGGTIAAITALLVVNVRMEPAVIIWLAPTFVLTPLIVFWSVRLKRGFRPQGMPEDPT